MPSTTSVAAIEATAHVFQWSWKGKPVTAVYEVTGAGKPILLLPAFGNVSTRMEMQGLTDRLAEKYQVVTLDWVGFGDSARPPFDYTPTLYHAFLREFVQRVFREPVVVIAAGHAAGYVMQMAAGAQQGMPVPWSWVVLVAPTWRGPLPTALGEHRWVYKLLRSIVRTPILGQFVYWLSTTLLVLRLRYSRHVFVDRRNLTRELMRRKWRTTRRRGARFASAAFITGALDPILRREDWVSWFQPLPVPVLMVIGDQMPPKSRVELEILAHFSSVQVYRMPGALGLHEEYPDKLADGIVPFLDKYLS